MSGQDSLYVRSKTERFRETFPLWILTSLCADVLVRFNFDDK